MFGNELEIAFGNVDGFRYGVNDDTYWDLGSGFESDFGFATGDGAADDAERMLVITRICKIKSYNYYILVIKI